MATGRPANVLAAIHRELLACAHGAGAVLLRYFGQATNPRAKGPQSSVVCDADFAAEKFIVDRIRKAFPDHSIISEESAPVMRDAEYTWVIDPLDGTSNFVAGIPWFGTQIGVLHKGRAIAAAMYLPTENTLYAAAKGRGAYRDGRAVHVTTERDPGKTLCAFGFDPAPGKRTRRMIQLLFRVSSIVRNTRATNSLVDFCYTIDGRLGGCINMKTMIWDIVPVSLILPEAGGRFTDLRGEEIVFEASARANTVEYAVVGGSRHLHSRLVQRLAAKS
jgi:myo-inositol-1(or 4)-monophosphatase